MLLQRTIVALVLLPFGIAAIYTGGWVFAATVIGILGFAAWEYWQMFHHGGYNPSAPALILGITGLALMRQLFSFSGSDIFFSAVVLISMGAQVIHYEQGDNTAAVDFNVTLGGILYLGWLGSYLITLRQLPHGQWWVMLVLSACWFSDGAAYLIGSRFGRHKLSRRVSPNKSWEGYIAGVISAAVFIPLMAWIWQSYAPEITPLKGLLLGIIIAIISPLGDLGESMLKRGFGIKDSSHVLPGHGGIMDRIDSWLWAAAIGYYLIVYAFSWG